MAEPGTIVRVTDRTKNRFSLAYALGYAIEWRPDGEHIQIYSFDRTGHPSREQVILRRNLFLWLYKYHNIEVTPVKEPMDLDDGDRHTYYKNYRKMYANL